MRLQSDTTNNDRPRLGALQLISGKISVPARSRGASCPSDALALVGDIVDDDVIAHLVGRGIENAAGIQARKLVDEALSVKVGAEHEGVDFDSALGAALHFF